MSDTENPKSNKVGPSSLPSPSPRAAAALEQATKALEEAVGLYLSDITPEQLQLLVIYNKCLAGFEQQYADDPLALLDCIEFCRDQDMGVPRWARDELAAAFSRYKANGSCQLKEAFSACEQEILEPHEEPIAAEGCTSRLAILHYLSCRNQNLWNPHSWILLG